MRQRARRPAREQFGVRDRSCRRGGECSAYSMHRVTMGRDSVGAGKETECERSPTQPTTAASHAVSGIECCQYCTRLHRRRTRGRHVEDRLRGPVADTRGPEAVRTHVACGGIPPAGWAAGPIAEWWTAGRDGRVRGLGGCRHQRRTLTAQAARADGTRTGNGRWSPRGETDPAVIPRRPWASGVARYSRDTAPARRGRRARRHGLATRSCWTGSAIE